MSKTFSDAPLKVDGITVRPKWKWSAQHRAEVAADIRESGRSDLDPEEAKDRYVQWYAKQHGLSIDEARRRVEAMG